VKRGRSALIFHAATHLDHTPEVVKGDRLVALRGHVHNIRAILVTDRGVRVALFYQQLAKFYQAVVSTEVEGCESLIGRRVYPRFDPLTALSQVQLPPTCVGNSMLVDMHEARLVVFVRAK
jgi:hypothetical protein